MIFTIQMLVKLKTQSNTKETKIKVLYPALLLLLLYYSSKILKNQHK